MALGCAFLPHSPLRHGEGANVWHVARRLAHQDGLHAPLLAGEGLGVRLVRAIDHQNSILERGVGDEGHKNSTPVSQGIVGW